MKTSERHKKVGTPPGTLKPVPEAKPPLLRAISYGPGPDEFGEPAIRTADEAASLRGNHTVVWINVDGLGDVDLLRGLGRNFGLHDLALEDVLAIHHRAKREKYTEYDFYVVRMPEIDAGDRVDTDQLSVFAGKDFVLTIQQRVGDCFDPIRERIRSGKGRIRGGGSAYLLYALLDSVVDSYYPMLERVGERLEKLEDLVIDRGDRSLTGEIHRVRRDLLTLRRAVWPLREILNDVGRDEDLDPKLQPYLRDCYDHIVELVDLIETYRDLAAGLMEVYVSVVGNRMNEIMKTLTIIATIFMPLSFVASVYGMNFDTEASPWNMPELHWRYGYVAVLGVMAVVAICLVEWFRRRGFFGKRGA